MHTCSVLSGAQLYEIQYRAKTLPGQMQNVYRINNDNDHTGSDGCTDSIPHNNAYNATNNVADTKPIRQPDTVAIGSTKSNTEHCTDHGAHAVAIGKPDGIAVAQSFAEP